MYELAIIAAFGFASSVLAYLGVRIGEENGPVQFLFLSVSLLFVILMAGLGSIFSSGNILFLGNTTIILLVIAFVITIFYFVLEFIKAVLNALRGDI